MISAQKNVFRETSWAVWWQLPLHILCRSWIYILGFMWSSSLCFSVFSSIANQKISWLIKQTTRRFLRYFLMSGCIRILSVHTSNIKVTQTTDQPRFRVRFHRSNLKPERYFQDLCWFQKWKVPWPTLNEYFSKWLKRKPLSEGTVSVSLYVSNFEGKLNYAFNVSDLSVLWRELM